MELAARQLAFGKEPNLDQCGAGLVFGDKNHLARVVGDMVGCHKLRPLSRQNDCFQFMSFVAWHLPSATSTCKCTIRRAAEQAAATSNGETPVDIETIVTAFARTAFKASDVSGR